MLEEFVRVLAKIVLLKQSNNYPDALTELDSLSRIVTGFSIEHLKSLGPEGIDYVFAKNKESHAEKLFCSAKILKEDGLIFEAQGRINDSLESFFNAKELFRMSSEMEMPERDEALTEFGELKDKLYKFYK